MNKRRQAALSVRLKVLAATIGVGGVVAMGTLTMLVGGFAAEAAGPVPAHDPTQTGVGNTITQNPFTSQVPIAEPALQAPPWGGKGWPGAGNWAQSGPGHSH
jgi:hypothetical protein